METSIIENLNQLYRSHLVTALLYLGLIIAVVLVTIGAIKFKLLNSKAKNIALVLTVVICAVVMIIQQTITIIPVYKDYTEQSYIVVENATMIVKDGASGAIDRTNSVVLLVDGNEIALKMQTDYGLDTETRYTGTIAYLKHSGYVVWYEISE